TPAGKHAQIGADRAMYARKQLPPGFKIAGAFREPAQDPECFSRRPWLGVHLGKNAFVQQIKKLRNAHETADAMFVEGFGDALRRNRREKEHAGAYTKRPERVRDER